MSKTTPTYFLPSWMRAWEQFWFTPADPSLLGLIRVACGMITVYTLAVYSFSLQDMMGKDGWHDMQLRDQIRHERPVGTGSWTWIEKRTMPEPKTLAEETYLNNYVVKHGGPPPLPFPKDEAEAQILEDFLAKHQIDLRVNGLPVPQDDFQLEYAHEYTRRWKRPPPAYPKDEKEALEIALYMDQFPHNDPRILYDKGMPVWSLWFHIVDPQGMAIIHALIVTCAFFFMIGFCTRITTALTWFGLLCYIQRNPTNLFGVDTMMTIVLLYLMISPCGAVFSVDALIRRWWARAKPGVVAAWCRFWKQPVPDTIAPAASPEPAPSVSANVAIRLLQIHVCIIYLVTGLSKLQGQAWWNGGALWLTLGNYEFAPMQFELYLKFLRLLAANQWLYEGFMTGGGLFTLAFEISYAFLVWRPRLRWFMLGSAILLHGFIGLFLGLKTFSFMMLVMNMAFLHKNEALWILGWFGSPATPATAAASAPVAPPTMKQPVGAVTGIHKK